MYPTPSSRPQFAPATDQTLLGVARSPVDWRYVDGGVSAGYFPLETDVQTDRSPPPSVAGVGRNRPHRRTAPSSEAPPIANSSLFPFDGYRGVGLPSISPSGPRADFVPFPSLNEQSRNHVGPYPSYSDDSATPASAPYIPAMPPTTIGSETRSSAVRRASLLEAPAAILPPSGPPPLATSSRPKPKSAKPAALAVTRVPPTLSSPTSPVSRKAAKRADGYTPRPPNAWILYRSEQIRVLKQDTEISKKPQSDISNLIGHMWRDEALDVRKWYEQEAEIKKMEHRAKYPDYRFCPVRKERPATDSNTPPTSAASTASVLSDQQTRHPAIVRSVSNFQPRKRAATTSSLAVRRAVSSEPPLILPHYQEFSPKQSPYEEIQSPSSFSGGSAYPPSPPELDGYPLPPESSAYFGGHEQHAPTAHEAWAAFESSTPQWFPLPVSAPPSTSQFSFAPLRASYGVVPGTFPPGGYVTDHGLMSPPGTGEDQSSNYPSPTFVYEPFGSFEGDCSSQPADYALGPQDAAVYHEHATYGDGVSPQFAYAFPPR